MSKTKEPGANHYEILFIIPNNYTEDEAKKISTKTEEMIKKAGGEINHQEYWGKKKLAYEIKKFNYGYYSLFEFDLDGKNLADLNRKLKLSSEVLRHQIIRRNKRSPEEIEAEKVRQEKSIKKEKEEKTKDRKEIKTEKKSDSHETKEKSKEKKIVKGDLKDLDKRLEGILDSKDLI